MVKAVYPRPSNAVDQKYGNLTLPKSEKEQADSWTEHFKEILNSSLPTQKHEINNPDLDLGIVSA